VSKFDDFAGAESTEDREGITLSSPLMHIEGFLEALTNANKDGRIVINKQSQSTRVYVTPSEGCISPV
jgi:hypothetical protein